MSRPKGHLLGFSGFSPPTVPDLPGVLYGPALGSGPTRAPFADALRAHRGQLTLTGADQ